MHTATYNCNSGFFLVGVETRTCEADGLWTGVPPQCIGKSMMATYIKILYDCAIKFYIVVRYSCHGNLANILNIAIVNE